MNKKDKNIPGVLGDEMSTKFPLARDFMNG